MDPYILKVNKDLKKYLDLDLNSTLKMKFAPAESDTDMMGGNSNWRGPIWLCSEYKNLILYEYVLERTKVTRGPQFPFVVVQGD